MTSYEKPPAVGDERRLTHAKRVRVALALLIFLALLSSRELLRLTSHDQAGGSEAVAYLRRFDEVKRILPARGVICYMPDPHLNPSANKNYFLAQYALAPLVLRTNRDCDLLLADFPGISPTTRLDDRDYLPVQDFGKGVALFRKVR